MWILIAVGVLVVLCGYLSGQADKKKRADLLAKYGDESIVDMILRKQFWQGQTEPQLLDSLGRPLDVDQKVFKTKTKETWKYQRTGTNRYALRIIVENGVVVGWDQK